MIIPATAATTINIAISKATSLSTSPVLLFFYLRLLLLLLLLVSAGLLKIRRKAQKQTSVDWVEAEPENRNSANP